MIEKMNARNDAAETASDLDDAVIVALGCNDKGDWASCAEALAAALARFRAEGLDVLACSSWWASQAWPDPTDPPFLNGAALISTDQDPPTLMRTLGRIEDLFGRVRSSRNAPRTLDLDLEASWFYSDSYSDLPMLERVGNPRVVAPDPRLRWAARARQWAIEAW